MLQKQIAKVVLKISRTNIYLIMGYAARIPDTLAKKVAYSYPYTYI